MRDDISQRDGAAVVEVRRVLHSARRGAGLALPKTLRTSSGLDGDLRGTNGTHLRVASSGSAETRAQG
jgi:hypothetical protein